ncbi:hypothetical protein GCM10010483_16960 [Actinokineospora diospyrosa]
MLALVARREHQPRDGVTNFCHGQVIVADPDRVTPLLRVSVTAEEGGPGGDGGGFGEVGEGDAGGAPGFDQGHHADGVEAVVQEVVVEGDGAGGDFEEGGDLGAQFFGGHRVPRVSRSMTRVVIMVVAQRVAA